jgi:hypothetical protein
MIASPRTVLIPDFVLRAIEQIATVRIGLRIYGEFGVWQALSHMSVLLGAATARATSKVGDGMKG